MTSLLEHHGEIDQSSKSQSKNFCFISRNNLTIVSRFNILLSIFILQFLLFLTLVGLVLTTDDSYINNSSTSSMNTAQESLVCPPPQSLQDRDPWACDLLKAQRSLRLQDCQGSNCTTTTTTSKTSSQQFKQLIEPPIQCLVLNDDLANGLCQTDIRKRRRIAETIRPSFCHKFPLLLLTDGSWMSVNTSSCQSILKPILQDLIRRDQLAKNISCQFDTLISRYNCQTGYSVQWSCSNCTKTYHDWICATVLPVFKSGSLRRPCHSFCKRVEERCPYLHPSHKEQYAGEPAFICIDPYIPFISSLTPVIPFDDSFDCFNESILDNQTSRSSSLESPSERMQSDDTSNSSRLPLIKPPRRVEVTSTNTESTDQEDSEEKSDDDIFEELDGLTTTTTVNPEKS